MIYRRVFIFIATVCLLTGFGVLAWQMSFPAAVQTIEEEAERNLVEIADQFDGQLSAARILPTLLARDAEVVSSLEKDTVTLNVIRYLERARDISGAHEIRLLNPKGQLLYSTDRQSQSVSEYEATFFTIAMQSALGIEISVDATSRLRTLIFARSILTKNHEQIGVVVVEVALEPLESQYRARPETLLFTDRQGVVVFSNRQNLLFSKLDPYQSAENTTSVSGLPAIHQAIIATHEESNQGSLFWHGFKSTNSNNPELVTRRLLVPLRLEAILLTDTTPAYVQARKITSLVISLLILALVSAVALIQRRRRLMDRLEAEQALSKELDRRVALRSQELEQAQQQLLQSEKLSALGKMSAGISHELNQPIASIQNFSVNAKRLIEKNRIEESIENLQDIETQAVRMSRIIKNLRDFSRKDAIHSEAIDINLVVQQVVRMLTQRIQSESIHLNLVDTDAPRWVIGGEIRLQQVLLNLMTNAIDAIAGQNDKRITVQSMSLHQTIQISILDNGPGLEEPNRVFEPFYTTKVGNKNDGLGLGLSIAYGFVDSFGGSLTASNSEYGGALFILELPSAIPENKSA